MTNQSPAEALRQHYKQEIEYVLETSDESGEVRITYADGHSEIKPAKVLLLDDIMHFVDAYVTAYAATVEREALKTLRDKMVLFPPNGIYEASMFAVTVNDIDDRLAALQGPQDGSDSHSEPTKS